MTRSSSTRRALAGVVLAALVLAGCNRDGGGALADGAIAAVDGEPVPLAALDEQVEAALRNPQVSAQLEADLTGSYERQLEIELLTALIRSELMEGGAQELDVAVSDADVEGRREEAMEQAGGAAEYQRLLNTSGITEGIDRARLRTTLLEERVLEALTEQVEVSDEDVREAYDERLGGDVPLAQHIVASTKRDATAALRRVRSGQDFATVAREVSIDPAVQQTGGYLGRIEPGSTLPAFEEAVRDVAPGRFVPTVVQTGQGFHVIQRIRPPAFGEVSDQLRDELRTTRAARRFERWLRERSERADVRVHEAFGRWDAEDIAVRVPDPLAAVRSEQPGTADD